MCLSFTLIIFKKGNHIKDKVLTYESHLNINYDRGCESWTLDQILKDGWIFVRCMQNHVSLFFQKVRSQIFDRVE